MIVLQEELTAMDVCFPLHVVSLRQAVQALRCVHTSVCVQGHCSERSSTAGADTYLECEFLAFGTCY